MLNACATLEEQGFQITYLPVDMFGMVSAEDVKNALSSDTRLVSIMLGNNGIGTIQPIAEIGTMLKSTGILFHTDAVQAVGHIPVDVKTLGVDFLTSSAHKFNGPKGVGLLYKKQGVTLPSMIYGGGQESHLRAGTENVAGIAGAGIALTESVMDLPASQDRLRNLTRTTIDKVRELIPDASINGHPTTTLPGIISITIPGISGESVMHILDMKGICISTGSACTSGDEHPSHVLLALGLSEQQAKNTIRISYGKYNTIDEVAAITDALAFAVKKIRR